MKELNETMLTNANLWTRLPFYGSSLSQTILSEVCIYTQQSSFSCI